jgi:transcriptional regulator with XRE-family HTH domain
MDIGKLLRELRLARGLGETDLATRTGVSLESDCRDYLSKTLPPGGSYTDLDGNSTNCDAPRFTETEWLKRQLAETAFKLVESHRDFIQTFYRDTPGASQVAKKSWIEAQKAYCENQPGAITPTWTGRKKPVPATGSEGFRLGPLEGFILDS